MRKVANRLAVLEDRYKDLPHQERAKKINEDLKETFCVGEREIKRWKSIVKVTTKGDDIVTLPPYHYVEIARLPEEKQKEVIQEATEKKLTVKQTALLVDRVLGRDSPSIEFEPEFLNLWLFSHCDEKFGGEYPGRCPGQVIQNLLWLYTDENDVILDPMAGSGTTLDVANAMKRQCFAYDLHPLRDDILPNDILNGIPRVDESVDFVFLDPPYGKAKEYEYSNSPTDLANIELVTFRHSLEHMAKESWRVLKPSSYCAILIGIVSKDGFIDYPFYANEAFRAVGFQPHERVIVNYGQANSIDGLWRSRALKYRFLLRGYRDLIIFKKEQT